ncbi:MAG: zinc-regulated TonB-dependent outer membrane receptor [Deltaproteobacteria bacterium]|nr:zinc-regulated TonB-dependent outer membrane receptor [Deltaproteobacteria bacterium]
MLAISTVAAARAQELDGGAPPAEADVATTPDAGSVAIEGDAAPAEPEAAPRPTDAASDASTPRSPSGDEVSAEDLAAIESALTPEATAGTEGGTSSSASTAGSPSALQRLLPDIAIVADFALAWFSDDSPLQSGGHDPSSNGFHLQQLELSLRSVVDPYFRFDANIVFSLFGVELEEAYATTLDLPAQLQVRAGQLLTRFGRINATHPHAWEFADQPFAIGRVLGGEGNRGLGLEVSWLTPMPWYVELVASVTQANGESTARSFYGPNDLGVDSPADLLYVGAVEQFFALSDDLSLAWGLSAAFGPNGTGHDNRTEVYGTDLYVKYRPISRASDLVVSLQSEWIVRRRQVPGDVLSDVNGYTQVLWRFARRWAMGARHDYGSPPYGQNGEATADDLDPEWTDHRHRATWALTFWPTEFSRIRLQSSLDVPTWRETPIFAAFLALELVAGAHGAHSF